VTVASAEIAVFEVLVCAPHALGKLTGLEEPSIAGIDRRMCASGVLHGGVAPEVTVH
jgi:hypothetical protein